ncbi:MAG: glycosyltransferase family 2 protein [Chlamydiales bacterium]
MNKQSIGIVIPTWKAIHHLPHCLPLLIQSPLKPRILIIDSSSNDGTVELARSLGVETLVIPKESFNHGRTREMGRNHLGTDIVVMMTQDAYPTSLHMLELLVEPLISNQASIAYARQIPHLGAGFLASFARHFNYPSASHLRSLDDVHEFGIYTFFCSNSCAAYLNRALDEIGGFPAVLFGEDTVAVARLLQNQHRIAYVAEAEVSHSHDYTLKQEFSRHFTIGLSRQTFHHLFSIAGKDSQRGKAYVLAMLKELLKKKPSLIPYALLHSLVRFTGYLAGKAYALLTNANHSA